METRDLKIERKIPDVDLARIADGALTSTSALRYFGVGRSLLIGVPGAFLPVCTTLHVPQLLECAERLRSQGFDEIACIVASDPFVTAAWAARFPEHHGVRFLSDGNLSFARALGLLANGRPLFLGQRSERYLVTATNGVIDVLRVERQATDYLETRPDVLLVDAPERHQFG